MHPTYDTDEDLLEMPGVVYIVDDEKEVRDSLRWNLDAPGSYRIETYESGETFIAQFNENVPSVIICDLRMPGMSGADVQDHLLKRHITAPFIFLTGHGDVPQAVEAFKKGAVDFIQKPFQQNVLKDLVNRMMARAKELRRRRIQLEANRSLIEKLTPREQQVLDRIVHGRLNKQIADDLGISIKTVEAHRASIMDKTGSGTVADLMRVVVKSELFPQISATLAEAVAGLPGMTAEAGLPHTKENEEHNARMEQARIAEEEAKARAEAAHPGLSTLPHLPSDLDGSFTVTPILYPTGQRR